MCVAILYGENPTFRRNLSPSFSGMKSTLSKKRTEQAATRVGGDMFGVLFCLVDGSDVFFRNVGLSPKYNTETVP
jgi:hypothetical protein